MSNYIEDYRMSTREERISLLLSLRKKCNPEELEILAKEMKKVLQMPKPLDTLE